MDVAIKSYAISSLRLAAPLTDSSIVQLSEVKGYSDEELKVYV